MADNSTSGGLIALGILGLAIYSCAGSTKPAAPAPASLIASASSDEDDTRTEFDEDAAREEAEEETAEDTYVGAGSTYGCTDDCSGHEAGWKYRAEHGYSGSNPDSPSFDQGGQAFDEAVEERVEEKREEHEAGEDDE